MGRRPTPRPKARANPRRRTLGDQLRDRIGECGFSESALADVAGVDTSSLGRFLRKERDWTLETAEKVAGVLGIDLTKGLGRR
jgi:plasmid maintenance system antidote protein VapI